uniref:ARAD1B00462p n=1 Tax=Blastobotrys adeninivorans TaxID=409370 RepID=A0A060T9N2_BLAAD
MSKRRADEMGGSDSQSSPTGPSNPPKTRIRVARACVRCKTKKTKCDGQTPCGACKKYGLRCEYGPAVSAARGSDSSIPSSSASSALLGSNPKFLAALLGANRDGLSSALLSALSHQGIGANGSSSGGPHAPGPSGSTSSLDSDESMNFISQILGYDLPEQAHNRNRYCRKYHSIMLSRAFGRRLRNDLSSQGQAAATLPRIQCYGWNMSGMHYLRHRSVPPPTVYLEGPVETFLLQYYFDHINPMFAILHKPIFMKQYEAYRATSDRSQCRLFVAIMYVACALAMRFAEVHGTRQFRPGLEEELFSDGFSALQTYAFEWEAPDIVQGFLLATVYLRTCHRQSATWSALGQALRLAYGMGMMRRGVFRPRTGYDKLKYERIFWSCYTMDRLFSLDLGRSPFFREEEITLPFPDDYVDDGWITPFAYGMLGLARVISKLPFDPVGGGETAPTVFRAVYHDLLAWNANMDARFGLGSDVSLTGKSSTLNPALTCHLRLHYHDTVMTVFQMTMFGMIGATHLEASVHSSDVEALVSAAVGTITAVETLERTEGKLNTPWYLILMNVYNACVALQIASYAGYANLAPRITSAIRLVDTLAADGRFAMAKEAQWSLRSLNHSLLMKFRETVDGIHVAGTEHGDSDVNRRHFAAMGLYDLQGNVKSPEESARTDTSSGTPGDHVQTPSQHGPPQHLQGPVGARSGENAPYVTASEAALDPQNFYSTTNEFWAPQAQGSIEWLQDWDFDAPRDYF